MKSKPGDTGEREKEIGDLPEQGWRRPLSEVTEQDLGDKKENICTASICESIQGTFDNSLCSEVINTIEIDFDHDQSTNKVIFTNGTFTRERSPNTDPLSDLPQGEMTGETSKNDNDQEPTRLWYIGNAELDKDPKS